MAKVAWLVVGAGLSGCVMAERIARCLGQEVLVIDRRDHIAGNAYDYFDEHGVLVHKYGPHIFHTNSQRVWEYLSDFTAWDAYAHRVLAAVDGQLTTVPFNLNSLQQLLPAAAASLEASLIAAFGAGGRVPVLNLMKSADPALAELARYVYEKIFVGYTRKQWGLSPEELSPSVTGRLPIRVSRDDRHFLDDYQAMPRSGYTEMCRRMLHHPKISVRLGADFHALGSDVQFERMVYTGALDGFFNYVDGELPYRSLRFEMRHHAGVEAAQEGPQINYPNQHAYTRVTEFKQITGQRVAGTTLAVEYPQPYVRGENEPYYPIPREENAVLYEAYRKRADMLRPWVTFVGRLADYKYYNMDQAIARALHVFEVEIAPAPGWCPETAGAGR